jgi:hypothetical protein
MGGGPLGASAAKDNPGRRWATLADTMYVYVIVNLTLAQPDTLWTGLQN